MKMMVFVMMIPVLGLIVFAPGQSKALNTLKWYSFDDGLALAKKEKKMVLIDFYTDWCGFCKKMDRETYSDQRIIRYLNEKYVLVKINPEKSGDLKFRGNTYTYSTFARYIGVNGYPSTLFMEFDEELITMVPGFVSADEFINMIRFLGDRHYKTMKYDEFLKTVR